MLQQKEANQKWHEIATSTVDRLCGTNSYSILSELRKPIHWLTILCGLLLLGLALFSVLKSDGAWIWTEAVWVEAGVLLIACIVNLRLSKIQHTWFLKHIEQKARDYIESGKNLNLSEFQDGRFPVGYPHSICRVIRDGHIFWCPWVFLVPNDTIVLSEGEIAPAALYHIPTSLSIMMKSWKTQNSRNTIPEPLGNSDIELTQMSKSQTTLPSVEALKRIHLTDYRLLLDETRRSSDQSDGVHPVCFKVLTAPITETLEKAITGGKPSTLLSCQLHKLQASFQNIIIPVLAVITFVFSLIRFLLNDQKELFWYPDLFISVVYVLLPLLPISWYILAIAFEKWGYASVLVLWDDLLQSQTPYDDDAGVDEFDEEAPPPVKNVKISLKMLGKKWASLWNCLPQHYTPQLLELLSTVTVICALDSPATVSPNFPSPEKIVFLQESNSEQIVSLDFVEEQSATPGMLFEDRDWANNIPFLKPIGLNILHQSKCNELRRRAMNHGRTIDQYPVHILPDASWQRCMCSLPKQIGFNREPLKRYERLQAWHLLITDEAKNQTIWLKIVLLQDSRSGSCLLQTEGTVEAVIALCSEYWAGKSIAKIDDNIERRITELAQHDRLNDLQPLAYAYAPVIESLSEFKHLLNDRQPTNSLLLTMEDLKSKNSPLLEFFGNQIFLGILLLAYQPKLDIREFIEDLRLAGIRFVYFSSTRERESKAFAERLGLETDWNSCIILSSSGQNSGTGYLFDHDIKTKLPRGVENIRSHLKEVDDIPLHVSLFADCSSESICEMIKIFQENGEIVCCFGNALNYSNSASFNASDISIGIEPTGGKTGKASGFISLAMNLMTLPTSLNMPFDVSPYVISQMIREARNIRFHAIQAATFATGCFLSLSTSGMLCYCLFLPPLYSGFIALWLSCIIIPLLAISFLFSPADNPDVMKLMPVKNKDHLQNMSRLWKHFLYRFSIVIAYTITVFVVVLQTYNGWVIKPDSGYRWLLAHSEAQWALIYAQICASFAFVYLIVTMSVTFLHRTASLIECKILQYPFWLSAACVSLSLHTLFCGLFLMNGPFPLSSILALILVTIFIPIVVIIVQELVKMDDKKHFIRFQKRSKLEFNTKLGCYSPV